MEPAEAKARLRGELGARRRAVPAGERRRASRRVTDKLLEALDWTAVGSLHVYLSMPAWGELDTTALIAAVGERWPEIEIVSPSASTIQSIPTRPFDLIIVPVLGFDDDNFRLGLGRGYYDRLLAARPEAKKIGLAYAWARVADGLPREPHDVALDAIVTEH